MEKPLIGFVGVGRMGANMARRLHDQGYPIAAVYDINREVSSAIALELNAAHCSALAEVTRRADVIFTVVSDDTAMDALYHTEDDNLFMGAHGKKFINCATISPHVHQQLMAEAPLHGAQMLECPMASSIPQARNGTLFLMVAGLESTFSELRPILNDLASEVTYTGGPGTAAQIKALVNMVMNINTAALAEGLGLADALGLDLDLVREVFSKTGANSRVLETDGPDMQHRDHDVYFSAAHAAKDSGIALALGRSCGLEMVLAEATHHQFQTMVEAALGHLDKSGISELTFLDRRPAMAQPQAGSSPR